MLSTVALVALVGATSAYTPAIKPEIVNHVNGAGASWVAHASPRFEDKPMEHVEMLCGTIIDEDIVEKLPAKELIHADEVASLAALDIPAEFDSRTAWPKCKNVIGHIRDQARCGSCWAFGSTEAFNDRLCIASDGAFQTLLSPQDTVNCCGFLSCFSMACNGGQPGKAWKWFTKTGVVTGGDFPDIGGGETCMPYQYGPTDDSPTKFGCVKKCTEAGYSTEYKGDKHKAVSAYGLGSVEAIQQDIMANGPVSGAFIVYEDFPTYKSGVYHHVTGNQLGGHAIKIIGWGTENGEDYWIVNNSWNTSWGEDGSFRIRRGVDECGIESMGVNGGKVQ